MNHAATVAIPTADRAQQAIGQIAVDLPGSTAVFRRLKLDFCCGGQVALFGGDYWFNSPLSQWGAVVTYRPLPAVYLRAAAYQVNPRYADERGGGLRLAPAGTVGTLTPLELGWEPSFDGRKGRYAVGGWYSSAPRADAVQPPLGALGSLLGVLPGAGLAMSSFSAYMVEKSIAKEPDRFGQGAVEGHQLIQAVFDSCHCFTHRLLAGRSPSAFRDSLSRLAACLTAHWA